VTVRHPENASHRIPGALNSTTHDTSRDLWRGLGEGWSALSYIVAGFLFWGGVGYLLDRWLGTKPVLFIVGALVGNFGGIYLLYLRYGRADGDPRAT
jgi:ATP synthase protein I